MYPLYNEQVMPYHQVIIPNTLGEYGMGLKYTSLN